MGIDKSNSHNKSHKLIPILHVPAKQCITLDLTLRMNDNKLQIPRRGATKLNADQQIRTYEQYQI